MDAIEVRNEILSWMKNAPKLNGCAIPSAGERGTVTGLMNTALKLDSTWDESNARRRMVLAWIFRSLLNKPVHSHVSAKELSDTMWWSLVKWVDAHKDPETNTWKAHDGFNEEIVICWQEMLKWQRDMDGQLGFDLEEIYGHK